MVYELVVLGSNEDESKKCSTKLLDGVLALLDALMIFQQGSSDDWSDMIRLCLGLLLKCSHHPNPGIVAMATAKLHAILQSRSTEDPAELSYLLYSINRALDNAIEGECYAIFSRQFIKLFISSLQLAIPKSIRS